MQLEKMKDFKPGYLSIKSILLLLLAISSQSTSYSQSVGGILTLLPNEEIRLEGYDGFKTYIINQTSTDSSGYFRIEYSSSDHGMGFLISADDKAYHVILCGEDIVINGEALSLTETLITITGQENQWFEQYAQQHLRREQALSAWQYLEKIYRFDSLFSSQVQTKNAIYQEIFRIRSEDETFLAALPDESYVSWLLPMRKLLSSVSIVAQFRPEEIPATRAALRGIQYDDPRLYKSGLLRDAIDSHVWFIENSSGSLDSVFSKLNLSIDIILSQLLHEEKKYNEITDYLFNLLEKRSLFAAAEHLSLRVLEETSCTVDEMLAQKLEGYRKLKKGNIAPDITFGPHTYYPVHISARSLKDIKAKYKVVVFAAQWCVHCRDAMPKLSALYPEWKEKGIEVVLISLDESVIEFALLAGPLPFVATCDYLKWESPPVKDYHVFGTPTYYVLKEDLEIVLKPTSVEQMDAYFKFYY